MTKRIETIDDLKLRCIVDEITGCWRLHGRTKKPGISMSIRVFGRPRALGAAIWMLAHGGEELGAGLVNAAKCRSPECCNPEHRRVMQRGKQVALHAPATLAPETRAKIALARRAGSRFDDATIRSIRADTGTLKEIAGRHGCSLFYAQKIRAGIARADLVPAASVFSWRPTC